MKSPVIKHALKYKKQLIFAPLFKVIEVIGELLTPFLVAYIIDNFIVKDANGNVTDGNILNIVYFVLIIIGIAIFTFFTTILAQRIAVTSGAHFSYDLRESIFNKYEDLSKSDIEKYHKEKILTLINVDTLNAENAFQMIQRLLLRGPLLVIGGIIASFIINVNCGFIFLSTLILASSVIGFIMVYNAKRYHKLSESLDDMYQIANDNVSGNRVIRAFNNEDKEISKFSDVTERYRKKSLFFAAIEKLGDPLTFFIINIGIILVLYVAKVDLSVGNLTSGKVVSLISYFHQTLFAIIMFARLLNSLSRGHASKKRIDEFLSITPSITNGTGKEFDGNEETILSFSDVSLSFKNNDKYALSDISFTLNKGETLGIIGGTGAGKTSLIRLIERFYDASKGTIKFKGKDLKELDIEEVRNKISLVNQKCSLLKGTILSNMLLAAPNATEEEIINALTVAKADFVFDYKDGINHVVEENGANYSGGQKQRLNIARAILKKKELLILDDSTSALDYITDKEVRKNISSLDKDLSVILISQRATSLTNCDKIIVLDKGKIESIGTHKELLSKSPIYQEIFNTQVKTL